MIQHPNRRYGVWLIGLIGILLSFKSVNAQHDSLILKNGDVIVGEIKSLDKGVLTIETDYSKKDFTIEWSGIKEIYSKTNFLMILSDGQRLNGSIQSSTGSDTAKITLAEGIVTEVPVNDIVFLKGLKSDFFSRLKATIDMGLSFTKANNLQQLTINSSAGYMADKWQFDAYYDIMRSAQDSVQTTKRTDGAVSFKYFLQRDWFASASVNFLSNTEQALKLRTTGKLGAGKFIRHTNQTYFAVGAGLSFNNESFTNNTAGRNSLEAFTGSELNLFDIGDLNLLSSLWVYPSLTEKGRWRTDFGIDVKYDLPLDFYIKMGLTLNYDNKPAIAGNTMDYVLAFTIGWELE